MGTLGLILTGAGVGLLSFVAGRLTRRIDVDPSPPSRRRPTSILVERVEAPGSRPIRICARKTCGRAIVKHRDGDEMVVRIEGESIVYLHGECADAAGEPLP